MFWFIYNRFFFTKETANKVQSLQLWNFKGSVGRAIVKWVLSDLWLDLPGSAFSIHCSLMMICRHVPCDKPLGVMRFKHEPHAATTQNLIVISLRWCAEIISISILTLTLVIFFWRWFFEFIKKSWSIWIVLID